MADSKKVFDDNLAAPGFIKTNRADRSRISGQQRAVLIRRGNEFFNQEKYEEAKRIFVTVSYTDGLIRMGDYYSKRNDLLEAFRMYWLAPERRKVDYLVERMATIVRSWLKEDV